MEGNYSYPDPGDAITFKVIERFQTYASYWSDSERNVLDLIHDTISKNGLSNYTLLDVGCGEGRLFADFICGANKIVGIEPDSTRYENAIKCITENKFDQKVLLLNTSLEQSHLHREFDIVLSSHIIQHIPSHSVRRHLELLAEATKDNGLLIINTNVSGRRHEYFIKGFIDGQSAVETEIDEAEFNTLTQKTGQLPVHMFDRSYIETTLNELGFELVAERVFHVEPQLQKLYGAQTDEVVNGNEYLKRRHGRDICFIFRKQLLTKTIVKGALAEFCVFNVKLYGTGKDEMINILSDIKKLNAALIDTSRFCKSEECKANTLKNLKRPIGDFECLCGDEADKFCSTGQTINRSYRYYIGTTYFNFQGHRNIPLKISVTFFPYRNIGIVCFNVVIKNMSVDEVIALKQYFGNTSNGSKDIRWRKQCEPYFKPTPEEKSEPLAGEYLWFFCNNLIKDISKAMNRRKIKGFSHKHRHEYKWKENDDLDVIIDDFSLLYNKSSFVYPTLEIDSTDTDSRTDNAELWAERNCRALYGLLVGDEGYKNIPRQLALKRISEFRWSTRKFVSIFAYSQNSIMLNFKTHSDTGMEYMSMQQDWSRKYYDKSRNIYFIMPPCIAGIDHGLFRVIERNIIVYFENEYISKVDQSSAINLNKKRNKILLFLYKTTTSMDEINDLFNIISRASGTAETIDSIKQRLSLRSEEKNLKNQRNNNDIILILTLASIILGFMAVTSGSFFFDYFGQFIAVPKPWLLILILIVTTCIIAIFTLVRMINWKGIAWNSYRYCYKRMRKIRRLLRSKKDKPE